MAKIERTKNASRNIVFGFALKIYQILVPFLMRTAMIYLMGVQYLGLNSLFTSILQVLNLAELGVGSAMVYSMYRPIAEDDNESICALMNLYRTYYRAIGLIITALGAALLPFIPRLIKSDVPGDINIYVLYIMNLGATVLSYWLFAYKNSILQAHQRIDVVSRITFFTNTIQYVLQLLVLYLFRNYYYYVIVLLATQVITNITTAIVANKMYPNFGPKGKLAKEEVSVINKRIRDLFTSKVGSIIINSADTIVISAFLGLTVLAVYQNYFFIISSIIAFITILFNSIRAGIGNSLVVETKEKNFEDLKTLTLIISWISGICVCCFLNLFQPFMKLWVGEKLMLEYSAVICFCIYFFVFEINSLLNLYKDAGGIWHEDRFRPLVTAISNLAMNLIMVQFWGIYGVLLSTVLSSIIVGMPWLLYNLFTTLFDKEELFFYLRRIAYYSIVALTSSVISWLVCRNIVMNEYLTILVRGIISILIPLAIFFVTCKKLPEYISMKVLLNKMTKGKFDKFLG